MIDLRSDTVTLPTDDMRKAMANAVVGDDVYQEDPTVIELEKMSAEIVGKEAGLFLTSGTMGNLVAVLANCQRGDEVIIGDQSHTFLHEVGGISALGGVTPHTLPNLPDGTIRIDQILEAFRGEDIHEPTTKMIILENTHNRCGGVAISKAYLDQIGDIAKENSLSLHIDGARIFNAAIKMDINVKELLKKVDSITFCLSKGLGAPVGSVLCGPADFILRARKLRKQLGGGMRQSGIIAAGGIYALTHHIDRLVEDHQRAIVLANGLKKIPGIHLHLNSPQTNMVFLKFDLQNHKTIQQLNDRLKSNDIFVGTTGTSTIRMVTHLNINDDDIEKTIQCFSELSPEFLIT